MIQNDVIEVVDVTDPKMLNLLQLLDAWRELFDVGNATVIDSAIPKYEFLKKVTEETLDSCFGEMRISIPTLY
ncbi:hypothetical protein UFOVP49_160 [uncultured Caudovirales phage]|uniref:Uncharacterized protein n=1 Tax=uncultured Caudovirales phage TaxID=2100421 RepID=A0A6J5KST2_9CAUD|nr:hypothetical protein UFOVP49_160 [uncultured Caudovirales phage]